MRAETWNVCHLNPGGFVEYRVNPEGFLFVRKNGKAVDNPRIHAMVRIVIAAKEKVTESRARGTEGGGG
jgi:hypothetical protein